jgi:hypothetical protein
MKAFQVKLSIPYAEDQLKSTARLAVLLKQLKWKK